MPKGGGVDLIIGLGKPGKGKPGAGDDGGYGDEDAKREAAQDILDAIAAKDADALTEALTTHYDLCAGGGMPMGDEDEESDEN